MICKKVFFLVMIIFCSMSSGDLYGGPTDLTSNDYSLLLAASSRYQYKDFSARYL